MEINYSRCTQGLTKSQGSGGWCNDSCSGARRKLREQMTQVAHENLVKKAPFSGGK